MYQLNEDTIAALATPAGVGAISVIRVSGPESVAAVDKLFSFSSKLSDSPTHTIHYGKITSAAGEVVDDVLVSLFRSPNSYTGEDSVEISTHGSPFITQKVMALLLDQGIRLAEPGEFTRRAFMNGKIDLAQAEAVVDIINSSTEASLRGARNQLDGILSAKIDSLREMLINISSFLELELDFAEEELEFVNLDEAKKKIKEVINEIEKLLETYTFGKVLRDGVNVAIVGKPNVGKSSLLNYILKEGRAIVSDIPGTTRDVIREEVSIDGVLFKLFDTAGIRTTEDSVEIEGVIRSKEAVKNADLVIFINDSTDGFSEDVYKEILELKEQERVITVLNKIDLGDKQEREYDVKISAKTGKGIDSLFSELKNKSIGSFNYSEKSAVVSNLRHKKALENSVESMRKGIESIEAKMSQEFVALDLRNAEDALGEIIGKVTTDDILNNIFKNFCIGK
jgi:tRNA modification GTPase